MKRRSKAIGSSESAAPAKGPQPASFDRRQLAAGAAAALIAGTLPSRPAQAQQGAAPSASGAGIKQSVCRWCYSKIELPELIAAAQRIGLDSIELLDPKDLAAVREAGLQCAMVNSHPLFTGLAHERFHEACSQAIRTSIEAAVEFECPSVITFSGNRRGISDEEALANCEKALLPLVELAEAKNITLCMELLNSKVDHPDYLCDHTPWGVELVERVGSQRFRLLYDIYHMQIMEGDVIRTIREHHDKIAHYHTAGVPGRHELDDQQELFYPAIVRAILDTGYAGYLGQEFIPRGEDPLAALAAGVDVCRV